MSFLDRNGFFAFARPSLFGGKFVQSQVDGLNVLLDFWELTFVTGDRRWLAYILATAHHEVGKPMQPIREYGDAPYFFRMYDRDGERPAMALHLGNIHAGVGVLFCGRGYVQLTGRNNYTYWETRLGLDLTSDADASDRVLDSSIAAHILFHGMIEGTFADAKLADYFHDEKEDWLGARNVVHGVERQEMIADYAIRYYRAILEAVV